MNIASFFQIKYTSALTHNVSGTAKACVQSIIAWFVYRNPLSAKAIIGLVASILGSFVYGKFRYDESEQAKKEKTRYNQFFLVSSCSAIPAAVATESEMELLKKE